MAKYYLPSRMNSTSKFIALLLLFCLHLSCVNKSDLACAQGGNKGYKDFQDGKMNYTEYIKIGEPDQNYFDSLKTKLKRLGINYKQIPLRTGEIEYDSINCYYETQNRYLEFYLGENFIDSIKQTIHQMNTEENYR
ncbi:MAG: hypothetical protein P1U56_20065 [Saprospiraceae bacterium]|nr:hypothetical protein [Saprospiraceae bacterium]